MRATDRGEDPDHRRRARPLLQRRPVRRDRRAHPRQHSPAVPAARAHRRHQRRPGPGDAGRLPDRAAGRLSATVPQRWAAVMVTAVEGSAVADASGSMHGFPAALTSFVGRAAVVDGIADQLGRDRLVTLTGPGGAGKTRLAGEVAKRVAGRFGDGVWLAELAAVGDPAQVAAAVAAALGIRDLPAVAAADALAGALSRRQLLLGLGNCEPGIGAAAE